MLQAIQTSISITVRTEDMDSYLKFLSSIEQRLVEKRADCVRLSRTETMTKKLLLTDC